MATARTLSHAHVALAWLLQKDAVIAPIVGATYPLEEAPAALHLLGRRQARGKVVLKM